MMFVTFGAHGHVNALKGDTITAIGPKYFLDKKPNDLIMFCYGAYEEVG